MSSLVMLGKQGSKLGLTASDAHLMYPTNNLMGIRVLPGKAVLLGGKQEGETVEVVEVNQTVLIYPAMKLNPVKYQTFLSVNPEMFRYGICGYATIVEPGEGENIFIQFKASRRTDLKDLKYLLTLYQID
jgi:hypothetical protein